MDNERIEIDFEPDNGDRMHRQEFMEFFSSSSTDTDTDTLANENGTNIDELNIARLDLNNTSDNATNPRQLDQNDESESALNNHLDDQNVRAEEQLGSSENNQLIDPEEELNLDPQNSCFTEEEIEELLQRRILQFFERVIIVGVKEINQKNLTIRIFREFPKLMLIENVIEMLASWCKESD
eukprot:Anaeramoba_flamelloidesa573299_51.p1 GENE.a573299_51~~a573299_51.p1  ORF type:complete len:182 (-),score=39.16 a573299_51:754-1299(-)